MTLSLTRRSVLKGLGVTLALPWLEAMKPLVAGAAVASPAAPKRLCWVYVPNGAHMQDWTPISSGASFEFPETLKPLASLKDHVSVLSGLTLDKARANGDGAGDHARAMAAFLTGRQPRKTSGADIKVGVSIDQFAAQRIGDTTRFPSLEIGCERGQQAGNCDSGYSCAYSANLSWRTESTPQPKETDPRMIFERLFSDENSKDAAATRERREKYRKSILDFVAEDARRLRGELGATDQRKLDEYLSGVREVELRIQKTATASVKEAPKPDMAKPNGTPREYQEHIRLLADLMVLAFQGDLTRIGTFAFANDGSNRPYPFIGVSEGHHDLSHHSGNKEKQAKIAKINQFHIRQFAYFLERLKSVKEGERTLLDNILVVYGSGIGDGNRHNHDDLPVLLAGKGGGAVKAGQHLRFRRDTPLMNLYLSMLDTVGVRAESFGDSTGRLSGL